MRSACTLLLVSAAAAGAPSLLPTGQRLDPEGTALDLGSMPMGMALAPGGRKLVIVLSGWREQGIQVVDLQSLRIRTPSRLRATVASTSRLGAETPFPFSAPDRTACSSPPDASASGAIPRRCGGSYRYAPLRRPRRQRPHRGRRRARPPRHPLSRRCCPGGTGGRKHAERARDLAGRIEAVRRGSGQQRHRSLRPVRGRSFARGPHPDGLVPDGGPQPPYSAIVPQANMEEMNPPKTAAARMSEGLDLSGPDRIDDALFNRILWAALKGEEPMPRPQARGSLHLLQMSR